ncbi:hypothetical protein [Qingshengfaniella alkalisoli]|uniref:Excalibur calcium-binding domain-containing protein n=1 Tax=Qingshengfaniella alkalisoli TaxID=2599296 RepID=A0A5B8J5M8_9RHOB|nr:hypothetical protein [Qingshengfaniella alkalisoli]QDY69630.1 hypothetical protein FPZ52_08350 [Qingshengfaniella alkalisoli]
MRLKLIALAGLALAACEPIPNSGAPMDSMSPNAQNARNQELQQPIADTPADTGAPLSALDSSVVSSYEDDVPAGVESGDDLGFENEVTTTSLPTTDAPEPSVVPEPMVVPENDVTPEPALDPTPVPSGDTSEAGPATGGYQRDFVSEARTSMACERYASTAQAQAAFEAAGGPQADPQGLDPDGDGRACLPVPER